MLSVTVRRRLKKFLLGLEIFIVLVLGAGAGAVFGAVYQINKALPPESELDRFRPRVGSKIYSSDGVLLAKLAAEYREPVKLDEVPRRLQEAVIAIEDARFYSHHGLDYRALVRAIVANTLDQEYSQGFSTITQQLARNLYLSRRKSISRKAREILLAVQIEKNWTKRQILETYLNQVYLGAGAYGVKAAAQVYFGKPLARLTLAEMAMLAGLAQRPSRLSPYTAQKEDGNYNRTLARRNLVLDRMRDLRFITAEEAAEARAAPIKVQPERPQTVGYFKAQYFVAHVVDLLHNELGYDQQKLDNDGLVIHTTLDYRMQQAAERAAREGRDRLRRAGVSEAALVCVDPHTGYIRAMVGGVNEPWEKYQFNCATQARRQPGSSFKTFVYAAALEQGSTVYSTVPAGAIPIRLPNGKYYTPKNHGRSGGSMSYLSAFASSVNGAAVNVGMRVGPARVKELAERLGLNKELRAVPSLALGTSEVTPLEMACAYGVFPAGGRLARPMAITAIRDSEGGLLEEFRPRVSDVGLDPRTIEGIHQLTRAVVTRGTGRAASGVPNAHGKTGTTEEYTDAWFVGYTPELAAAVWCGNRNNRPMSRVYGGTVAAPIWAAFMRQALELNPTPRRAVAVARKADAERDGPGKVRTRICDVSGQRSHGGCPSSHWEYFEPEDRPGRCTEHRRPRRRPAPQERAQPGEEGDATGGGAAPAPVDRPAEEVPPTGA
jgi:1A family penicillin-binding protein